VVRPMIAYGLPNYLRVTIATPAENDRFLEALSFPEALSP
jgi:histidinol-phosphate/aromatic aminotransferase/cobyric acid decarboxylase-like protein